MNKFLITMPYRMTELDQDGKKTYVSSDREFTMEVDAETMEECAEAFETYFATALLDAMEGFEEIEEGFGEN